MPFLINEEKVTEKLVGSTEGAVEDILEKVTKKTKIDVPTLP